MPEPAVILGTPPLRKVWSDAKKKSEEAAAKTKPPETSKLADLKKKMKGDLGPDLEGWPKNYPKWDKLSSEKIKIDATILQYSKAIKDSSLSDPVKKPMTDALTSIKTSMGERLKQAEELVSSDLNLAVKESKKKQIPPLVIFNLDVAKQVASKAGKTKLTPEKIYLEVILSDDKVIKNVPEDLDDNKLAVEIREAASFSTIIDQLAKLLVDVGAMVKTEKDIPAAEQKYLEGMDDIIQAALARAAKPVMELAHVRSDYRMYKIKKGASIGLAVVGVVSGVVGLAATPFTGGASTVLGIISIVKGAVSIGAELGKLALEAEGMIGRVADEIRTLNSQYQNAKKAAVGGGEMAKTFANAVIGPAFTTIKNTKSEVDQVKDKINGLTVKTHDESQNLGKLLTEQTKFQKELSSYEQSSKAKLTPEEIQKLTTADKAVETSAKAVDRLMTKIENLDARVKKCSVAHKILEGAINQLAAQEPTWAKVGEILIEAVVAAGFMVGGNVNVPDAFKCMELVSTINTDFSNILGSLQGAYTAVTDLNDLIKQGKAKGVGGR